MAKTSRRPASSVEGPPPPGGYTPPASTEAEQSVLGAILVRPEVMDQVADLLGPDDFYREAHGRIYQAILDLYRRGEPVDLVTITALLKERGQLEGVGGPAFLAGLAEQVGFAVNAQYYAGLVHSKSVLRRLLDCVQGIAADCLGPIEDVEEFLDGVEQKVFQVAESKIRPGFNPVSKLVDDEIANLEAIWHREKGMITGVPSGFKDMDRLTAGFQNGDLIILAARPSMGKTALALNIAFNAAYCHQVPVGFFSLEMSKEQLVRRLLSSEGRIDANFLRRGYFPDPNEDWSRIQEAAGRLIETPLYIDDSPAATVLEVRAKSRRLKAEGKLGLVIVDYLQLMKGRHDAPSREQEISEISRNLKALAKELHVPVLALSQLSRKVEDRNPKIPQLADLRESGAIEQDADVIFFIYRDEVYKKENSTEKGFAWIFLEKQRNGPTGKFRLAFQDKFTRFELAETAEPPPAF
ncbi:MAG: replicative DNA helicase [Deltaproteobacteria bacterium]|nr:replicative DNA helicase [Deltaproteobacteria bacterium]